MRATKRVKRKAKRLLRLCLVDGLLDDGRARQVAQHVGEAGKRDSLVLLQQFQRLVRLECARLTATVESAVPMPADVRADVEARLAKAYGPGLSTSFAHVPALLGGMRIKVGSDVYDGSVQAELAAIEASL
jgi:F-type H+-transporting ATPase subunit delta